MAELRWQLNITPNTTVAFNNIVTAKNAQSCPYYRHGADFYKVVTPENSRACPNVAQ
jgi:hypothetical protein